MPAVGGYFDTPSGAGVTTVPLDFDPALVIFLTSNQATEGWHQDGNPYVSVGFGSWGDLAQTTYCNGCMLIHFSTTGDGNTGGTATQPYDCIQLRSTRNGAPIVAAQITSLGQGFELTWSASASGYRVYYLAVTAEESYAISALSGGNKTLSGFSRRPTGGFGLSDPTAGEFQAPGWLFTNYVTASGWSWSAYDNENAEESLSGWHMAKGESYDQSSDNYTNAAITQWGMFVSASSAVAGTLYYAQNTLGLGATDAGTGTNGHDLHWVSADPSAYFSQTYTLSGNVNDVIAYELKPANPSQTFVQQLLANWGFTMMSIYANTGFHGPPMGVSFGIWAGDNDFHAAVAVGKNIAGGQVTCYNGRDYSVIAGFSTIVAGTDFIAGKLSVESAGELKVTVLGKNGTPAHDHFNVFLGSGDDIRHLLPILGVGE